MIAKHCLTFDTFDNAQAFAQELLTYLGAESGYEIEGMPVTIHYQPTEGFILEITDELVKAMGILKIEELLEDEENQLDENDATISESDDVETDEDYIPPSSHCLHCGIALDSFPLDGSEYLCPACD